MGVIHFYGSDRPDLFRIEREAMDRAGKVIARLDALLPGSGNGLGCGAGDGFTAERLGTSDREVIPLEPSQGMLRPAKPLRWVAGEAEHLPFHDGSFDAAYSTWAYFFSRYLDVRPGLSELRRVVKPGGILVIVENLGQDQLSDFTQGDSSADLDFWKKQPFECEELETSFQFENVDDASALLSLYRGTDVPEPPLTLSYRVGLFVGRA